MNVRWLVAAGFLAGSVGQESCTCKGSVSDSASVVRIEFPTDGAVLSTSDDLNPQLDGIQINVVVHVSGVRDGSTVVLSNSLDVDGSGVPRPTNGEVQNGQAVFPGYTLPIGELSLRAALSGVSRDATCDQRRCDEIAVSVVENVCEFTTPRDGDVLTEDAYPSASDPFNPFETDVVLDCRGLQEGRLAALRVNGGLPRIAAADAAGRVIFERVALAEGANQLSATSDTDESGENPLGGTTTVTVTVSTGRCTATLIPGDGSRLLAVDDVDQDPSNGMQANLAVVTNCPADSTIELWVQGPSDDELAQVTLDSVDVILDEGNRRFLLAAVNLPESSPDIAPRLIDEFDVVVLARVLENEGTRTGLALPARYWVDSSPPQFLVISPSAASCVGPLQDADNDPSNGIQINSFGNTLSGAEPGTEVWVTATSAVVEPAACAVDDDCSGELLCRDAQCRVVTVASGGSFVLENITVPVGDVELTYVARDLAGNHSTPVVLELSVFDSAPSVSILSPLHEARLGIADDLDPLMPDLQTHVEVQVSNVPAGTLGTLLISGQTSVQFVPPAGEGSTIAVPVDLRDGERTIRARVQDPCGNNVLSAPVTVFVSSDPEPVIAIAYESENNGFAERRDIPNGATTRVGLVDLDVYTGVGLGERSIAVSVEDSSETGAGGELTCLSVDAGARREYAATVDATNQGGIFSEIDLLEGANCFTVEVDDGVNVLRRTLLISRRTSAPVPAFVAPDPEDPTTPVQIDDENGGFPGVVYTVLASLAAADTAPGMLTLWYGDLRGPSVQVAPGVTDLAFPSASFPSGVYGLRLRYEDAFGNVAESDPLEVSVNASDALQVVLTGPVMNAAVRSHEALAVTVASVGSEAPESCEVFASEDPTEGEVLVASGAWIDGPEFTVPADSLNEGIVYLRAVCNNSAPDTGSTQWIALEVDDTAPPELILANEDLSVPGRLVFDSETTAYVNSFTQDTSSLNGLQHPIRVLVPTAGVDPRGWLVELTVTLGGSATSCEAPLDGATFSYSRVLPSGGDPSLVAFQSIEFGAVEGPIGFSVQVTDRAGNVSQVTSACLIIDVTPPVVTQTSPDSAKDLFTSQDDANADPLYVDLNFSYHVTGAEFGSNLLLDVIPAPATVPTMPVSQLIESSTVSFGVIGFEDGVYSSYAEAKDAAGNVGVRIFDFEIRGAEAKIEWWIPNAPGTLTSAHDVQPLTPGFYGRFVFDAGGIQPGTMLKLCSSLPPPSGVATPCRWGSDGTLGGPDTGYEVAAGALLGTLSRSSVVLNNTSLAQGEQVMHAEAREPDGSPDVYSPFFTFIVDSIPPVITGIAFNQNDPANDIGPTSLRMGLVTEGTPSGNNLVTQVSVTVEGAEEGRTVRLRSNVPQANTIVGSGILNDVGVATFNVSLSQGTHVLRATVVNEAGNANNPELNEEPVYTVGVDFTPGSVSLPTAGFNPYTSAHGAVEDGLLRVSLTASFSDNQSLAGGELYLRRFANSDCTNELQEYGPISLSAGQSTHTFDNVGLALGSNYLQTELLDATHNAAQSPCRTYNADFTGPDLELFVYQGDPLVLDSSCSTGGCEVDTVVQDGRATLGDLSELYFTLQNCITAPGIETCQPVVWLESRVVGASNSNWATVYGSVVTSISEDVATHIVYPADYAFDTGITREVRLVGLDQHGNRSESSSVFIILDHDGVFLWVERLDAAMQPTGEELESGTHWGVAQNLNVVNEPFTTNLRVYFEPLGSQTVTNVCIQVVGGETCSGSCEETYSPTSVTANYAEFDAVQLYTSSGGSIVPNLVLVTVQDDCLFAESDASRREYTEVIADLEPPEFQFDRCTLCDLRVPLVPLAECTGQDANYTESCGWCFQYEMRTNCDSDHLTEGVGTGGGNVNPSADVVEVGHPSLDYVAIWNAALDPDGNAANGFTTTPDRPLVVLLSGVEEGQLVRIESNRGGLGNNTTLAKPCSIGSGMCAEFTGLQVPTLSGSLEHQLTVHVTDKAGNVGQPDSILRGEDEMILARTDVIAPAGVSPSVCIGESTTPVTITSPEADPPTFEPVVCADACAGTNSCSRLNGEVTLVWTAPGDDGDSGDPVSYYEIMVAARGIPYPRQDDAETSVNYADCADFVETVAFERPTADEQEGQSLIVQGTASPGEPEQTTIGDLLLHRSYCFVVQAVDDVGNRSPIAGFQAERVLPLMSYPDVMPFEVTQQATTNRWVTLDDQEVGKMYSIAASNFFEPDEELSFFGTHAIRIGDMDGDGRDDFAVSIEENSAPARPSRVLLFLSTHGTEPAVSLRPPSSGDAELNVFFGFSLAGGDFNNDGLDDLAVCAPMVDISGKPQAGAVYLYYGKSGEGIRRDLNSADSELPSVRPDVAIFGASSQAFFCAGGVFLAEISGGVGDDLVVGGAPSRGVYGFISSGDPQSPRFPASPPATTKVYLTTGVGPGFVDRPDFEIARPEPFFLFPSRIQAADVNGDGVKDVVVADHRVNSEAGELYIYRGGGGLVGAIPGAHTHPAQLMYTIAGTASAQLGLTLHTVPTPRPGDSGDWFLTRAGGGGVYVFKGSVDPTKLPADVEVPWDFMAPLDVARPDGTIPPRMGTSAAYLGAFGTDLGAHVAVAGGRGNNPGLVTNDHPVIVYRYDPAEDHLVKRSFLYGSRGFGAAVVGAQSFAAEGDWELLITQSGDGTTFKPGLFLFR